MSLVVRLVPFFGVDHEAELLAVTNSDGIDTGHIRSWNPVTNVWWDVTGFANFSVAPGNPIDWATHKGVTIFTGGFATLPIKYTGGLVTTTTLGGNPPFAKVVCDYMKYLFLWNVTTADGIFTRQGLYSPDYDFDWSECSGHEINLDETSGEVRAALTQGPLQLVYKSDCIVAVRFIGGNIRFQQEVLPFDEGILAPRSLQSIGNAGHMMLATDLQLYTIIQGQVRPLPNRVLDKLQTTMDPAFASMAMSAVDSDKDTYYLFYKTNTADTWARGRIAYNFRTGEFAHRTYAGHEWIDALGIKLSHNAPIRMFASTAERVHEINDITAVDDAGTPIDRHYTSDWRNLGNDDDKSLQRVELVFERAPGIRVKVSVAADESDEWLYERSYDLKGRVGKTTTTISHELTEPLVGRRFNVRVRFYHDRSGVVGQLRAIYFKWSHVGGVDSDVTDDLQTYPTI